MFKRSFRFSHLVKHVDKMTSWAFLNEELAILNYINMSYLKKFLIEVWKIQIVLNCFHFFNAKK
jgi:hypothetical protein